MRQKRLNVGCGTDIKEGWYNLDNHNTNGANTIFDLNKLYEGQRTYFKDNFFDYILIKHVLHLFNDPLPILNELYRICKIGGIIEVKTHHPIQQSSINWKKGEKISTLKGYAQYGVNKSGYSLNRFSNNTLKVIDYNFYSNNTHPIIQFWIFLMNLLPYNIVEKTLLMYFYPLSIRVVYQKKGKIKIEGEE